MNCLRLVQLAGRQHIKTFEIISSRCITNHPIRFMETEKMWRDRDNVSKRWQLIYKAPMDTALKFATTYLTFSTSVITVGTLYYAAFVFDVEEMNHPVVIGDDIVIANSPVECFVYLASFIALHIAIKVLLSKYVIRMYQDGDEYLAIFRGNFYNSIKKHKFSLADFKKLKPTLVVSWGDARFDLGNKHGIILENYFKTPEHFNYLLNKKRNERPDMD